MLISNYNEIPEPGFMIECGFCPECGNMVSDCECRVRRDEETGELRTVLNVRYLDEGES